MQYAAIFQIISNILRNKWFWFAVLAIVIYVVIRRNWFNLQQLTAPVFTEPSTDGNGNPIPITQARQAQLRKIASDLWLEIHDWLGFSNYNNLVLANACSDSELKYLANYYASVLNKTNKQTSLYKDLDDLIMPFTDLDDKICLRLAQMGKI